MKGTRRGATLAGVLVLIAGMAFADWDPGDPYKMHWPQLPDLNETSRTSIDVDDMNKILADDFQCTATGPITDVHIWASFADDNVPDPGAVQFRLSIHSDIPDPDPGNPDNWSMPGELLWEETFTPGSPNWTWRPYAQVPDELFWDPATGTVTGDTQVFQYNFYPLEPFHQRKGEIYWLDVQIIDPDPLYTFGWKSARPEDRWNDDAVFLNAQGQWIPLKYPQGIGIDPTYEGDTMDLAFVITPEPTVLGLIGMAGLGLALRLRRRRS